MSANVKSMAYVRTDGTPWWIGGSEDWGQGVALPERVLATEILGPAGIDWEVETIPVFTEYGELVGHRAIVRRDVQANLGLVTDAYQPIQNRELAEALDNMTGKKSLATTAGILCGSGERCWVCIALDDVRIKGEEEPLKLFAVATTGHDGRHQARIFVTARPVCQNTLRWGLQTAKWDCNLWHLGDTNSRLNQAVEAMGRFVGFGERMAKAGELLMETKYTEEEFGILAHVLTATREEKKWYADRAKDLGSRGWKPTGGNLLTAIAEATREHQLPTELVTQKVQDSRDTLERLFHTGIGITDEMQDTAWAALQAVSEYADHHRPYAATKRGTGPERRITSILEGKALATKEMAMEVIQTQTGTSEAMDSIFAM